MPTNYHDLGRTLRLPFFPVRQNEGYTARGRARATLTMNWGFGQTEPLADDTGAAPLIKWCEPLNDADGKAGGICSRSGMWFPGHMLVKMDGRQMGKPFAAPEPRRRR